MDSCKRRAVSGLSQHKEGNVPLTLVYYQNIKVSKDARIASRQFRTLVKAYSPSSRPIPVADKGQIKTNRKTQNRKKQTTGLKATEWYV